MLPRNTPPTVPGPEKRLCLALNALKKQSKNIKYGRKRCKNETDTVFLSQGRLDCPLWCPEQRLFSTYILIGNCAYSALNLVLTPNPKVVSKQRKSLTFVEGLVRTSAAIWSVRQYAVKTDPFPTKYRIQWYWTLICLVLAWFSGFLTNARAP